MREMKISGKTGNCRILVGESISSLASYCNADKVLIVTDWVVQDLYRGRFPQFPFFEIGQGEEAKTLATVEKIYDRMLGMEMDRSSMVVGIGGGIACDIAGFAASTYMRGVRLGFAPTTLVAQADAAVGGKNGVNLHGYKNLVGTFKQPEFVLCDIDLLRTLPQKELSCGFAEMIKHAAIADAAFFSFLEAHLEEAMSFKRATIETAISNALSVKAAIVSADETEKGERMKLNFGHTIGHAVEKCCLLSHGEAVSIGMAAEAKVSCLRGMLAKKDAERLAALLSRAGLPVLMQGKKEELLDAIAKDKKRKSETIRIPLLDGIGKAKITEVKLSEMEAVLDDLH